MYIVHIKNNLGNVDIIFVSSHEEVRKTLSENNISTVIIYPNKSLKSEWLKRFKERGNNEGFINFISANWDNFIDDIKNENNDFIKCELQNVDSYIDLNLIETIKLKILKQNKVNQG